jgi:predicted DsbA family dithiol-disulfide isomerase
VHRSFQLDPAAPRDDPPLTVDALAGKYGTSPAQVRETMAHIEGLAAADGLEYHLTGTRSGNTFDAHRLLHLAAERGRQDALRERFYRAYFTEGRSVFDRDALRALATESGLDGDEVGAVLSGDAYGEAVRADAREAATLGVTGVPFFVLDRRLAVSGAQSVEVFGQALVRAWTDTRHRGQAACRT